MNCRYDLRLWLSLQLLVLLTASLTLSCNSETAPDCLKSTGRTVQQERRIAPVTNIVLYDNIDLYLTHSPDSMMTVEAGENVMPKIETIQEGSTLTIRNKNTCNWMRTYKRPVKVTLGVPHDNLVLTHHGFGKIQAAEPLQITYVQIGSFDAGGDISLHGQLSSVTVYCNSPAHISLAGQADRLDAWLHNSIGRLSAETLAAKVCSLKHAGSNEMRVFPVEELQVTISGNGTVAYYHEPAKITSEINGGGKLVKR